MKLETELIEKTAQLGSMLKEFSSMTNQRNAWQARAANYRLLLVCTLVRKCGGYIRFKKDILNPDNTYSVDIKEDGDEVRLKIIEKRERKYVKTAEEAREESKLCIAKDATKEPSPPSITPSVLKKSSSNDSPQTE